MKLDRCATQLIRNAPGSEGNLMRAVAAKLYEDNRERLTGLNRDDRFSNSSVESQSAEAGVGIDEINAAAAGILDADEISFFVGTEFLRFPRSISGLVMLTDTLRALGKCVTLVPLLDRNNQRGAWDMGVLPGVGPGFVSNGSDGLKCDAMLNASINGEIETLYVVGEDIFNLCPDERFAKKALEGAQFLIVQDTFMTGTARMADLVLPSASFAEKRGTFTNQEGRVQRISPLVPPPGEAMTDFQIFGALADTVDDSFAPMDTAAAFEEIRSVNGMYRDIEFSDGKLDASLVKGAGPEDNLIEFGEFVGVNLSAHGEGEIKASASDSFRLVTGNHLYFSGMLSSRSEILSSLLLDPVVEISDVDAAALGLKPGEKVVVKGDHASFLFILRTRKGTRSGVAFIAENYADAPVNRFFRRGEGPPLVGIRKA
jgi:NADH-quinone oxidoreductase subunit G